MSLDLAFTTQMQKRIADEQARTLGTVATGSCKDFSEYRYACGYLKCLDDMQTIAGEILDDIRKG